MLLSPNSLVVADFNLHSVTTYAGTTTVVVYSSLSLGGRGTE